MQEYLPLITGSAGALVVLALIAWAFYNGHLHSDTEYRKLETERDYWRTAAETKDKALETERRTVNETAEAGQVTNQLLGAVVSLATEGRKTPAQPFPTAKDLGL